MSTLFVRNSSGLVREINATQALFFNFAALAGGTIGWVFWIIGLVPEWSYGAVVAFYAAIALTGVFGTFYGLIFTGLTAAMPKTGGDYVFTSRIVRPFWGWLESWTLVWASIAIIGFEITLNATNWHLTFKIMALSLAGGPWASISSWMSSQAGGVIVGVIVAALILLLGLVPARTFHKVVTGIAIASVITMALMIVMSLGISNQSFVSGLAAHGYTIAGIEAAATKAGWAYGHPSLTTFFALISVVLFQFIGYQYSAYMAGELRGNLRKTVLNSILLSLGLAVILNAVYPLILQHSFGGPRFLNAWAYLSLGGSSATPLGEIPYVPLAAAISQPHLWPIWVLISLGGLALNFLLCPVYVVFISRVVLAWALDRQVPEWLSEVNERTHTPLRATVITVLIGAAFYVASVFGFSPATTAWYSVLLAFFTWLFPGINAILVSRRRPDLAANMPYNNTVLGLPLMTWFGILWLAFIVPTYLVSFFWPVLQQVIQTPGTIVSYASSSGIAFALLIIAAGVAVYYWMKSRNAGAGIDSSLLFQQLPPD